MATVLALLIVLYTSQCTPSDPKFQQYFVEGQQLYITHCSNCHQRNGSGLRLVYPPLAGSDYMEKNFGKVICGMKYGMKNEITVNGNSYHQRMPGVASLTELELAEIATYIYNSWDHQRGLVDVKEMGVLLDSCKAGSGTR